MPSTAQTPYLGLSQWAGSDFPQHTDFYADNLAIDTAVNQLADQLAARKLAIGTYAGNGQSVRILSLDFAPSWVFVFASSKMQSDSVSPNQLYHGYALPSVEEGVQTLMQGFEVKDTEFLDENNQTIHRRLNMSNKKYLYIAIA